MPRRAESPLLVRELMEVLDQIAPFRLAESWDNVGLLLGEASRPVRRVMVALDATSAVLAEARKRRIDTLIVHHPLLFAPFKRLDESAPTSHLIAQAIRQELTLIASHTNLDSVAGGTNGEIADRLALESRRFLKPIGPDADTVKYVVFVPGTHVSALIDAIADSGAGVIGRYSHCTFRSSGVGTYKPMAGAKPYAGEIGRFEEADGEVRLEAVCPKRALPQLLAAVNRAHPYEEVAFDVYPMVPTGAPAHGLGLVGELPAATTLADLAGACRDAFGIESVGVIGPHTQKVRTVAICSGSGGSVLADCRGADVLVTGELAHHHCIEARERGLGVILAGHYESEVIVAGRLVRELGAHPRLAGRLSALLAAETETSPVWRV